jgi:hypothetical protein
MGGLTRARLVSVEGASELRRRFRRVGFPVRIVRAGQLRRRPRGRPAGGGSGESARSGDEARAGYLLAR